MQVVAQSCMELNEREELYILTNTQTIRIVQENYKLWKGKGRYKSISKYIIEDKRDIAIQ